MPEPIIATFSSPYKSGDVYGGITLTGKSYMAKRKPKSTERFMECICECGKIWFARFGSIKRGETTSCGCRKIAKFVEGNTNHGLATISNRHPLYNLWASVIQRCYYKKHASFHNYGAMGVTVCEEWKKDFKPFYDWAIENGWQRGLDLDKDKLYKQKFGTDGKIYCPEYCCFVTRKENSRYKRTNHLIEAYGEIKCIAEWSEDIRCKVSPHTLYTRISRSWDFEKAISSSLKKIV